MNETNSVPAVSADRVFRPAHYTKWTMEPITFLILNNVPYAEGNIIKYVMRWRDKNGIEDLKKAMRYLEMMIEFEENGDKYLGEIRCL